VPTSPTPRGGPLRLLRAALWLALAAASARAALEAWADYLSHSPELRDRERAVGLLDDPALAERLADRREETGGDPLPGLRRAVALDPENSGRRLRLAARAELSGDFSLAERSLLDAARLSRLYQPRYALAQFYFRRRSAAGFDRWSDEAFRAAWGDVMPLLDLVWRARPEPDRLAEEAVSRPPEIARQYLMLLVDHQQTAAAGRLALEFSSRARPPDLAPILAYCNLSLSEGSAQAPVEVWNRLCARATLPYSRLDPGRGAGLTNADFARAPLAAGFDWHPDGAQWLESIRFRGELELRFGGRQPEAFLVAWQYVPVFHGKTYRLRWRCRPLDAAGCEGLGWAVYDAARDPVAARTEPDGTLVVRAPSEVVRLALMYRRPAGVPRLAGGVAIGPLSLEVEP
jgi:hypothetical protein